MKRFAVISALSIIGLLFLTEGCDSVFPKDQGSIVIEAYFNAGKPLPRITVKEVAYLTDRISDGQKGVSDAIVSLLLDEQTISYVLSETQKGVYEPAPEFVGIIVEPGAWFQLTVNTEHKTAFASGLIPAIIEIRDIRIVVSDDPVAAILVDTLDIGLDSLNLGLDASTGLIYPVQVSVDWFSAHSATSSWIETRLEPLNPFSSSIVDFFLLPSQVFREENTTLMEGGLRSWSGVYAVPVESVTRPIPQHQLKITLLRSDEQYARFATSRNDPIRREPATNLIGAMGFAGGISIDSVLVSIPNQGPFKLRAFSPDTKSPDTSENS